MKDTEVGYFIDRFDERWDEVYSLLDLADISDENMRKTLCRASIILAVANLEGFLTGIIKALLKDINSYSSFSEIPIAMKHTYVRQFYEQKDGEVSKHMKRLTEVFDTLEPNLEESPFLFNNNKNPKALMIERLFSNLGGKEFFTFLVKSEIENVFQNDSEYNHALIDRLRALLKSAAMDYVNATLKRGQKRAAS